MKSKVKRETTMKFKSLRLSNGLDALKGYTLGFYITSYLMLDYVVVQYYFVYP